MERKAHIEAMDMILRKDNVKAALQEITKRLTREGLFLSLASQSSPAETDSASELGCSKRARRVRRGVRELICFDSKDEFQQADQGPESNLEENIAREKSVLSLLKTVNGIFKSGMKPTLEQRDVLKSIINHLPPDDFSEIDPFIFSTAKAMVSSDQSKVVINTRKLASKIQSSAEGAGFAFTLFLVGKHLANGDLDGLGFDALNLYVLPKVGEQIASHIMTLGERMESQSLKTAAPVVGRAIGNFAAFLGLYQAIKARENAQDEFSRTSSTINIASNSVFIAADLPALGAEMASGLGFEVNTHPEY
jgi:hypothetical protein